MRVPMSRAAVVAMKDLHEAHAALNETASHQKLLAERLGFILLQAKLAMRYHRFRRQIDGFGNGPLHLEGELIAANAGGQSRIVRILHARQAIELAEQREFGR